MSHFTKIRLGSRKHLNKPNMGKVLDRLRRELDTLMDAAPAPPGTLRRAEVHVNWSQIERHVRELWGHENGR